VPRVLVFGSNLLGKHGKGAALLAREKYGAQTDVGRGRTGMAYAIPTKKVPTRVKRQFNLQEIEANVGEFILYAREQPKDTFVVTRTGCGYAGYTDSEIAPMFKYAPDNCEFDPVWTRFGLKAWTEAP